MFRPLKRIRQQMSDTDVLTILKEGQTGILAVQGDEGYPYAVPVNYTFLDGKIFFHSAQKGHKIDAIKACDKVSFCVIEQDRVVPHLFATDYRSVIAFGRAHELTDPAEILAALRALNAKYAPAYPAEGEKEIESGLNQVAVMEIAIEHLTGKTASAQIQGANDVTAYSLPQS